MEKIHDPRDPRDSYEHRIRRSTYEPAPPTAQPLKADPAQAAQYVALVGRDVLVTTARNGGPTGTLQRTTLVAVCDYGAFIQHCSADTATGLPWAAIYDILPA